MLPRDEKLISDLREKLKAIPHTSLTDTEYEKAGVHLNLDARLDNILTIAALFKSLNFTIECAFGIDRKTNFEIVYLFCPCGKVGRVRVRLTLPEGTEPVAPSITSVFDGANWYEREMYDMFGIAFTGHPNLKRILLPYSSDYFPLRKSFTGSDVTVLPPEDVEILDGTA
jgi:NADH-quinone oxidoreductase subunit C